MGKKTWIKKYTLFISKKHALREIIPNAYICKIKIHGNTQQSSHEYYEVIHCPEFCLF